MWRYQYYFRVELEMFANRVLESLGAEFKAKALLVGARVPRSKDPNPVCIEPEDGEWSLELFKNLHARVRKMVACHPMRNRFCGDEVRMREKPEEIRRHSVTQAVKEALEPFDSENGVESFCGLSTRIGNFYVVPILQIDSKSIGDVPEVRREVRVDRFSFHRSLVHAGIARILEESTKDLCGPDPGRNISPSNHNEKEIIRRSAREFMKMPGAAIGGINFHVNLFDRVNAVAALLYEGNEGKGRFILVDPKNVDIEWKLKLERPVPFADARWTRKILQMTSGDVSVIADCREIYGLGGIRDGHDSNREDVFEIECLGRQNWQLRCGEQILIRCVYGEVAIPQKPVQFELFASNYQRLFRDASSNDVQNAWDLLSKMLTLDYGTMIVFAEDAKEEAARLSREGSVVEPCKMSAEVLHHVSKIDGSILLDPYGMCYAIGVILDGTTNAECSSSRGSRYNSAIRYVYASKKSRLAIVTSDDRTIDVTPAMRFGIKKSLILEKISAFENATRENYHSPLFWLDDNRFYLNEEECSRVNVALDRVEKFPKDVGQVELVLARFEPDPEMNDTFLLDE